MDQEKNPQQSIPPEELLHLTDILRMVDEECAGQGEAGRPTPERGPLAAGSGRKRT